MHALPGQRLYYKESTNLVTVSSSSTDNTFTCKDLESITPSFFKSQGINAKTFKNNALYATKVSSIPRSTLLITKDPKLESANVETEIMHDINKLNCRHLLQLIHTATCDVKSLFKEVVPKHKATKLTEEVKNFIKTTEENDAALVFQYVFDKALKAVEDDKSSFARRICLMFTACVTNVLKNYLVPEETMSAEAWGEHLYRLDGSKNKKQDYQSLANLLVKANFTMLVYYYVISLKLPSIKLSDGIHSARPFNYKVKVNVTSFCNGGTLDQYLERHLNDKKSIKIIVFQIIYTLMVLRIHIPGFRHNDFHIKNILLERTTPRKGYYIKYVISKDTLVYLPDNGVTVKIFDYDVSCSDKHPNIASKFFGLDDTRDGFYDIGFLFNFFCQMGVTDKEFLEYKNYLFKGKKVRTIVPGNPRTFQPLFNDDPDFIQHAMTYGLSNYFLEFTKHQDLVIEE
jgi:hypothetical protein